VPEPKRRATYEDLMQVPDTKVAEIVDGELFVSPRPASPHAFAATVLGTDLVASFHRAAGDPDGPGGWWLLFGPEIHFGEDVVVPDWAGWRRERMPVFPDAAFFTLAPDWVCEVVSPSTGRLDRSRKMGVYGREGVANLWLVDPLARTLEIYRLEAGRWVVVGIHAGDDVIRTEPFAATALGLTRWWPAKPLAGEGHGRIDGEHSPRYPAAS
jgi:Uma2 family endonuclease